MASTIYRATVTIRAPVNDTEVTSRVADAITNIFPDATLDHRDGELVGETHSLEHFSELLHRREILDTARAALHEGAHGRTISVRLKKQPAFHEVVTFSVGEPDELGDIHVTIEVDEPDVETFIDHVAPPTEDGRPIEPTS